MNFNEALEMNTEEVKRPPALPAGYYTAIVKSYDFGELESDKGKWDTVDFKMEFISADEDSVDPDELAAYGELEGTVRTHRFMFPHDNARGQASTIANIKDFLEKHLECGIEGMTMKEAIAEAPNHQCRVEINHRPGRVEGEVYDQIRRTLPLE